MFQKRDSSPTLKRFTTTTMSKILICVPSNGTVQTDTMYSIVRNVIHTKHEILISTSSSCNIVTNRTYLAKEAIEKDFDYLFFVDSDMFHSTKQQCCPLELLTSQKAQSIAHQYVCSVTNISCYPIVEYSECDEPKICLCLATPSRKPDQVNYFTIIMFRVAGTSQAH